ncbi:MAG: hypothetical protein J07HX5_00559 [halophilic archaeon J07HX5]|jgi:hypothetical protein|nr:MAG: hypothetical protein J07HX5_00559 [halophilic archaeon J07HX5]
MEEPLALSPEPLSVDCDGAGITVTYADGRTVLYRGVPASVGSTHTTAPGTEVHLLVTDHETGRLVYIDERTTDRAVLEQSGVGRLRLDANESCPAFPGVQVTRAGPRLKFVVDPDTFEASAVFVFEQDQFGERSVELLAAETPDR